MITQTIAVFVSVTLVLVHIWFTKKELVKQEDKVNDLDKKVAILESKDGDHTEMKKNIKTLERILFKIAAKLDIDISQDI